MRKFKKPSSKTVSGILKKHADGFGFLICDNKDHEDVYLSKEALKGILSDDRLEVLVFPRRGRFYGRVHKILSRSRTSVIGPLKRVSKNKGMIEDKDFAFGEDLVFDMDSSSSIQEGAWLQVKILSYPGSKSGFRGRVMAVLGDFPDALEDNVKMLNQYNIPAVFSKDVLNEAQASAARKPEPPSRRDLRTLPFVTIDSLTAKDFDDAIYTKKTSEGYTLFVSIADVSFFVREGGLDKEAFLRGNSTYFPGFVSPMLPEVLSEGLCSLKPDEDRLAFTCEMHFDLTGMRQKYVFYESMILNHKRLTYGQAQEILDGGGSAKKEIEDSLKNSAELAGLLMDRRFKEGSLNLDIPETEVLVNARGEPTDIISAKRLFSHQLIEELMLACNRSAAEFLGKTKFPALYRVHDTPSMEDISHLKLFFESIGKAQKSKKSLSIQKQFSLWLEELKNHPKKQIIHQLILRALPQACYSAQNRGHFGLSFSDYTHFTSPIRRYSDLMVHRLIKKELGILEEDFSFSKPELESKALFISQCEQRSVQAERQIENIKKARFMRPFLGDEFHGMISSVTKFGFFVTLKKYDVDGLVHLDRLGGRWIFDPVQLTLKSPSGYIFRQGDAVLIQAASCNIDDGRIDFDLKEHLGKPFQKGPRIKKRGGKHSRKNAAHSRHRRNKKGAKRPRKSAANSRRKRFSDDPSCRTLTSFVNPPSPREGKGGWGVGGLGRQKTRRSAPAAEEDPLPFSLALPL